MPPALPAGPRGRTLPPLALAAAVLLAACGGSGPSEPAEPRFGTITTLIGGRAWSSQPAPDQVVAEWNPGGGFLTISGTGPLPNGDVKTLHFFSCHTLPLSPAGEANLVVTSFQSRFAIPGAYGRWTESLQEPPTTLEAWSTGAQGDHIRVEALDAGAGTIRGSFRFHAATLDGITNYLITGRFAGRVRQVGVGCTP